MRKAFDSLAQWLTPYVAFLCAATAFFLVGAFATAVLPAQVALVVAEVVGLLGVALMLRRQGTETLAAGSPRWPGLGHTGLRHPGWFVPLLLWGVVLALTVNVAGAVIVEVVPGQKAVALEYAKTIGELLWPKSVGLAVVGAVSASVVAPLTEELFFRGTMLPLQRVRESAWVAIVLNGLCFSLLHLNTLSFLPLLGVGGALAWLTLRTRSVWPAVTVHAGLNFFNGVIIPQILRQQNPAEFTAPQTSLPLAESLPALGVLGVLAVGFGWWVGAKAPVTKALDTGHRLD